MSAPPDVEPAPDVAPASAVRVFLADDHAVVRRGLRAVLSELGGFEIVGEASDGLQTVNAPALARCDVLVLDLSLPVVSGTEVLRRVRAAYPRLAVVVHTMHSEDQFARRALGAGAAAYVSKESEPAALVAAIRRAASGGVTPARAGPAATAPPDDAAAPRPHETLSEREHEVFMLIVAGRTVGEVAAELDLHSSTISNHLARIKKKLGIQTVVELVAYAYTEGLREHPFAPPAER